MIDDPGPAADDQPGIRDPEAHRRCWRPDAATSTTPLTHAELAEMFDRHRRELHVHCYRMTGSVTDAEDLTQETFLRAWRARASYESRASLRTWLYRIATNACLDHLARRRRVSAWESPDAILAEDAHLDPYLDRFDPAADPGAVVAARETTELVVLAALLYLPPRQRAALIARDLLEFSAAETASLLDTTITSVNSLTQRARARLRPLLVDTPAPTVTPEHADLVRRYVQAHEHGDVDAIVDLLAADVEIAMPPERPCRGARAAAQLFHGILGLDRPGDWLLTTTRANGRPATVNYLRRPHEREFCALSIDVLDIREGKIVAIRCFLGDRAFPAFGLPLRRSA